MLPGTSYIEMARQMVMQLHGAVKFVLADIAFEGGKGFLPHTAASLLSPLPFLSKCGKGPLPRKAAPLLSPFVQPPCSAPCPFFYRWEAPPPAYGSPLAQPPALFSTGMLFLDEVDFRGLPTITMSLGQQSGKVTISSLQEGSARATHAVMLLDAQREFGSASVDVAAVQQRCPETIEGEAFYPICPNRYSGEFRALKRVWGQQPSTTDYSREAIGLVEYANSETTHYHLRTFAWLDAITHVPLALSDETRPAYAAAVGTFQVDIGAMQAANSARTLWSYVNNVEAELTYLDADGSAMVHIDGLEGGHFEVGWLETRRAMQILYQVYSTPTPPRPHPTPPHPTLPRPAPPRPGDLGSESGTSVGGEGKAPSRHGRGALTAPCQWRDPCSPDP